MLMNLFYRLKDDEGLIECKKGDLFDLHEPYDLEHAIFLDKDKREVLLKFDRLEITPTCDKCGYFYNRKAECLCLR
ncbi:hypothetical protein P4L01_10190 [Bacillus cereus]|nr:hypothetical protein [Bacillus cereus]MEC2466173.1 hypothetical protein [Bacillus cereus]MRC46361.1 hypothetical protein [Bacillus thuringiensis]MRC84461.1 hypothetical protein [Bacillus thuringiensis]OUB21653.1 hypothetical protein BK739_31755 [Bacillus thuringiensis serovar pirenaica]